MVLSFLFIFCCFHALQAQKDTTYIDFSAYVHLDSVMITAKRQGFSVEEFIKIVQNDHSLETSFNNLRAISYRYKNNLKFFNKKGKVKASYSSTNLQHYNGTCQWMEVLDQDVKGNYLNKKGNYIYYTSDLYKRVFLKPTIPCSSPTDFSNLGRSGKILEKRTSELKKLIYTPGKKANVPLIGGKTAIFSPEMIDKYDFSIKSGVHSSGRSAYIFKASIKPYFNMQNPNDSVVKFLEIHMEQGSYQVLSRNYKLQYNAGVYKFDILMMVNLQDHNGIYIPVDIKYDGYWKVLGKRRENCKFHFRITEFIAE